MIHLLAPQFLGWLPLAAAPVVFHLFMRLRRQSRVFPSLQFFLAADPHLHARRNLREWLILALRCAALALLILALSRPYWRGSGGTGEVSVVLVLDNSASMAAQDREGRTRFQRALAAALGIAEDPGVHRTGIVLTVHDPGPTLPDGLTGDRTVWNSLLDSLQPTHAAGRPALALTRAADWLSRELSGASEVHLFTDLQPNEWGAFPDLADPSLSTRRILHLIGEPGDLSGSVAFEAIAPPRRKAVPGRPYPVDVLLHHAGRETVDVTLCVQTGTSDPERRPLSLAPGSRKRVSQVLHPRLGQALRARFWLEGASASFSAEAWLPIPVSSGEPVWLLGRRECFGLLPEALSPGGDATLSGLLAETPDPAQVPEFPAVPLVAVSGSEWIEDPLSVRLQHYVRNGGTLLIAPSATDDGYGIPDWCGIGHTVVQDADGGVALRAQHPESAIWEDARALDDTVRFPPVRALRWIGLVPTGNARPLLVTEGGQIVLVETVLGKGRIVASGLAWSTAWSDLPRRGIFLAMMQTLALTGEERTPLLRAGDEAGWRSLLQQGTGGVEDDPPVTVESITGAPLRITAPASTLPAPVRSGLYAVTMAGRTRRVGCFGDSSEAQPPLPLPATSSWQDASQVLRYRNTTDMLHQVRRGRQGRSLFAGFLIAGLLCALTESLLAQRMAPSARGANPPPRKGAAHER